MGQGRHTLRSISDEKQVLESWMFVFHSYKTVGKVFTHTSLSQSDIILTKG